MTRTQIRVLVVDDSATVRRLLVDILESDPAIRVVGEAANGVEAVEKAVSLAPDLITMDVVMPVMDGLEATKEIMIAAPTPILIVSASGNRSVMDLSFDATQAGALMVVSKPQSPQSHRFHEKREQLLQMVKAMAQVKVVRRWGSRSRLTAGHAPAPGSSGAMAHDPAESSSLGQVVAIGTSTGGPAALRRILIDLPGDFAAPILVVQHMAKGFVGGLATWLNTSCRLHVKVAADGEALEPRAVYLAPDNRHLGVRRDGRTSLSHAQPVGGFRPAATFLFQSVARVYGSNAVGIILTGMGSDGVTGLKELRAAGGYVLAQDESSSVVYGMAQEAVQAGAVDAILPLEEIAPRLIELVA
jgi:two-component system, chemotaxis family, protein-glutamate methylesterase/glutaminase